MLTLHELAISGEDAWVTANKNIPKDLSKFGGAYNGALIDSAMQEYNLKTGKLLRTWDALDHIPLQDSYASLPTNGFPWDAYHVNSLQLVGNKDFLVSMRSTWAAYLVNIDTGQHRMDPRRSPLELQVRPRRRLPMAARRAHAARSTVTVFDDHCCQLTGGGTSVPATAPSRGLVLNLDQSARTATLAAQYPGDGKFETEYMGDTQPLPNGNVFVGWGSEPHFSEYSRSGKLLLEGSFPVPTSAIARPVEQWVGLPLSAPLGAARRHRRQHHGVRELERRHPSRLVESPRRPQRRPPGRRRHPRQVRL